MVLELDFKKKFAHSKSNFSDSKNVNPNLSKNNLINTLLVIDLNIFKKIFKVNVYLYYTFNKYVTKS